MSTSDSSKKGQSARKDPAWKYAEEVAIPGERGRKGYKYLSCKFCSKTITGGVLRVKCHLAGNHINAAPCEKVPDEVKHEMQAYLKEYENSKQLAKRKFDEMVDNGSYYGHSGGGTGTEGMSNTIEVVSDRGVRGPMDRFVAVEKDDGDGKMTPAIAKEHRNQVCLDIGRFFYENGIPFNCARSPSYFNMLRSIGNFGRGLKPPTMHELRTWVLDEEVKTTFGIVDEIKSTWRKTGVSILSDGWSDMRNRSLINFLVNNPHGTVFLKTIDASDCVKDAQKLFELLDGIVEEIGEDIVVQIIIDNASAYKAAGRMLMEKRKSLYWTPCAAHCIDLMLEKIGELPQHKRALLNAKKVSNFIYNHQRVFSLFRKFAKKDLLRPAATRFATAYLTLESMLQLKQPLQSMFVSREWSNNPLSKKAEGKQVKKIVMNETSFWASVVYSIKTTKPLVHVLRIVDGERTPAMGFIYGAIDEAKENIAKNFNNELSSYKEIWEIIDSKWDKQLHRDLHATAYYLNPRYRWSDNPSEHPEIKLGLYNCMDRLIKDPNTYAKFDEQLDEFLAKRGLFGIRASKASFMTHPPVVWWDNFGDEVPELKAFAMKILGLTCSSSACERNWSMFNQVHTKKRNCLSTCKLNRLVYIMYNKKLKDKHLKKQSRKDEDDPLIVEDIPSDDEWVASPNDEDEDDDVDECGGREEGGSSKTRKRIRVANREKETNTRLSLIDEEDEYESGGEEDDDDDDSLGGGGIGSGYDDDHHESFLAL